MYEEKYCSHCQHQETCRVWLLHLNYNSDQFKDAKLKAILNMFIPTIGTGNGKCTMFIKSKQAVDEIWKLKD